MSNVLTKKDLRRCLNRYIFTRQSPFNYETMQSGGWVYSIHPAMEKIYDGDADLLAEKYKDHFKFYNTHPWMGNIILGACIAIESTKDPDATKQAVEMRTALMGPLSGIGDSIYWGIVRCIAAGVGIGFAASGSILGPILFLVIYNLPGMLGRYYLTYLGFSMGENFITKAYESGMITILTKCAGIIGLMMVGFMISSNVNLSIALTMPVAGAEPIAVQPYLDSLLMGVLPLSLTLLCYWALKKKMNQNTLLFVVLGVGFVLGLLGIC